MENIERNLGEIKKRIDEASARAPFQLGKVTLIGVTKTVDIDRIQQLLDLGVTNLGENRVQELMGKFDGLKKPTPVWHMIGHLQTNKVKYILDKVQLIHSVDSVGLGEEISRRCRADNRVMDILVEVNVGGELSKSGVAVVDAPDLVQSLSELEGICVKGLMTVAPFVEKPENNRDCFKKMMELFIDIRDKIHNNIAMEFLSMGMTNDYQVAIEEGANMVRIGSGIFGAR